MYSFGQWDTNILFALNGLAGRSPHMDGLIVFTATYLPFILVALVGVHLYRRKRVSPVRKLRLAALAVGSALIARIAIGSPIRYFFPRPRPFLSYDMHQLIAEHAPSFPSGHALFFFAFSGIVYAYDRRLGAISFLLSLLICLARVAAGIHYPSDILAGAVLGTTVSGIMWLLAKRTRFIA